MKIISLFSKTPSNKRFGYRPWFYDERAEERKSREVRIKAELESEEENEEQVARKFLIEPGAFRNARKIEKRSIGAQPGVLRFIILLFLVAWLISILEFGTQALYGLLLLVPFYFFLKLKDRKKK